MLATRCGCDRQARRLSLSSNVSVIGRRLVGAATGAGVNASVAIVAGRCRCPVEIRLVRSTYVLTGADGRLRWRTAQYFSSNRTTLSVADRLRRLFAAVTSYVSATAMLRLEWRNSAVVTLLRIRLDMIFVRPRVALTDQLTETLSIRRTGPRCAAARTRAGSPAWVSGRRSLSARSSM